MIRTLQPNEEVTQNLNKALKSLKASLANIPANAHVLNAFLAKHFTNAEGVSDYSEQNITRAIWQCREVLQFEVPPVAPRTPNAQSQLNSNKERRAQEAEDQRVKAEEAEKAKLDEEQLEIHRQAEILIQRAGSNQAIRSAARRVDGANRLRFVWQNLLKKYQPKQALAELRAYWRDVDERELYRAEGNFEKLTRVDMPEMKSKIWSPNK